MNIEQLEQKIIAFKEGDLTAIQEKELLNYIEQHKDASDLWNSYDQLYDILETMPEERPTDNLQFRFNEFLEGQEDTSVRKTVPMYSWKKVVSIAAVLAGMLMMWNVSNRNHQMEETLANVNNQLHQMMQNQSPTERIKTIRVNYAIGQDNADAQMIQLLVDVLVNDGSSNVRLAAVETLGDYAGDEGVRTALIRALGNEGDGAVKHAIVGILGSRIDSNIKSTLEKIVNDDSQEKFVIDEAHMQLIRYNSIKS